MDFGATTMKRAKVKGEKQDQGGAIDLMALVGIVERFASQTVVVWGDFVADAYQFGDISRVSREAPVLILRHRETRISPGGGANAASNFASLGAKVLAVSAVGDDEAGSALVAQFRARRIDVSGVLRVKGWTTPTKTRFLAGWTHTVGQQVLRVDYEPAEELPKAVREKLVALAKRSVRKASALAVSDYGFGAVRPEELKRVTAGLRGERHVTLDSRYRLAEYAKAGVTSATPNEAELEAQHHTSIGRNLAELERCGEATRAQMKLNALLVTRGKDGMAVFEGGQPARHVAIHGSDQAVDVTGAGDTVLAAYTLSLASGASAIEAAHIANIAGSLVVMKRGTATVSSEELLKEIQEAAAGVTS
jgi:D-glycero-beta-D-manno-heptose-7-phosphate kinase